MAIYVFEHPETGEIFETMRKMSESDKPFFAPDGIKCKRIISKFTGWKKNKEVFEADSSFVKKCNPKYVKFQDGHREKYDSNKHC